MSRLATLAGAMPAIAEAVRHFVDPDDRARAFDVLVQAALDDAAAMTPSDAAGLGGDYQTGVNYPADTVPARLDNGNLVVGPFPTGATVHAVSMSDEHGEPIHVSPSGTRLYGSATVTAPATVDLTPSDVPVHDDVARNHQV